jgi:RNA polymerase sigma-70 factor (ECF subfamily)
MPDDPSDWTDVGDSSDRTDASILFGLNANPSDRDRWARFYRVYDPAIRRWLRHWGLQAADVDDVSQDVLMRLIHKLPAFTYDRSRSFRGWLKTVVHNVWHDFATNRRRKVAVGVGGRDADPLAEVAARDDLEARIRETYDQELLEWAMAEVKRRVAPTTWEAFERTAVGREQPQTVADQLGMGVELVYVHKSKVTKMIRERIRAVDGGTD